MRFEHVLRLHRALTAGVVIGALAGCSGSGFGEASAQGTRGASAGSAAPSGLGTAGEKMKWEDAAGGLRLALKPDEGGYDLTDAAGSTLGRVRVKGDRVVLKAPDGTELRKIKTKPDGAEVEDAGGVRLLRIKLKADGGLELEDAGGSTVVKAKRKEDGYELREPQGSTLAKVKAREGKVVLETESGDRLSKIEGTTDTRAAVWLAAPGLTDPERAALFVYYLRIAPLAGVAVEDTKR